MEKRFIKVTCRESEVDILIPIYSIDYIESTQSGCKIFFSSQRLRMKVKESIEEIEGMLGG